MKQTLAIVAIGIIIAGIVLTYYLYNKPHVNVSKQQVDHEVTLDKLLVEFNTDINAANQKYADKILLLTGVLHSDPGIDKTDFVLSSENGIANCELDSQYNETLRNYKPGDQLRVKGIFVGYDDLLGELQLKKCMITE